MTAATNRGSRSSPGSPVDPRRHARPRRTSTTRTLEFKRLFSELWGTFLLVLVAAGGGVVGALPVGGELTLAMKALAPGMMVMGIIFFMGTISGAHLNPAVTLAFAARGNFPWRRVPGYIVAQIIGGLLAALFLQFAYGGILNGATEPGTGISDGTAVLTEAILTLGLVSVILGTASGARNVGFNGALAVGAYIGLVSVWGAPISGASMNPGRSLAPMLVGGDLTHYWVYLVGPDRRRADRCRVRVHPARQADQGGRGGGPGHPRRGPVRNLIRRHDAGAGG